jgi:hypothetical protein
MPEFCTCMAASMTWQIRVLFIQIVAAVQLRKVVGGWWRKANKMSPANGYCPDCGFPRAQDGPRLRSRDLTSERGLPTARPMIHML